MSVEIDSERERLSQDIRKQSEITDLAYVAWRQSDGSVWENAKWLEWQAAQAALSALCQMAKQEFATGPDGPDAA